MATFPANERTSARYSAILEDENEEPIPASTLSTLTLTLYDEATGDIINSRDAEDVLNANDVTLSSAGELVWTMGPADNVIVNDARVLEPHIALFAWTYGAKAGKHEVRILVKNLSKVT